MQTIKILPQKKSISICLESLWHVLFPYHFEAPKELIKSDLINTQLLKSELAIQIDRSHSSVTSKSVEKSALKIVELFWSKLDAVKKHLMQDAMAAVDRDPSVENIDEVILAYPGFLALMTYRLAHELALMGVPLVPRMMSEVAHARTGCDIHPEAKIGQALFIDHATGVVIGQTAVVGDRVTLYQGVTLGALAIHDKFKNTKRHPTIEDDVIIYANATILGGSTIVGKRSVIGGSCWITYSVEPDSKIILANPKALVVQTRKSEPTAPEWDI